ncbi:MAG: 1,4-alpha-glucan branching protein GlgB [Proteobacteria bacterium]|nr:1,4-alpha-glucan branching protein GlgB [Pseudomonadota bacterium]MBU1715922.1 1,4-alpha-glucan branching protein GlgB [Pseudomonadota bacterium]
MTTDIEIILNKVIESDLHDPFQVLGFHVISETPPKSVIRTFQPHADSMRLIIGNEKLDMYKMRKEGLYEIIIPKSEPFEYAFEATFFNNTTYTFNDPYRTLPHLSEDDRYLFNKGTNYEIYNHLGSHLTSINNITGTMFRVWAPNARRVSVIGDFNAWDGRVHQMRILDKSGIWELFIPGIEHGDSYKYEIRTSTMAILEKTDPYQFFSELRPKTASIVWNIDDYKWNDAEWIKSRGQKAPYDNAMSIYEVHLGSWQRDPADTTRFLTFKELADTLIPYVKKMGFTHLELLPIMEHPLDESWGYQTTGYFASTSRHGTPQEFMFFVDRCHQNGIGIILDWVPSHFPTDGHCLASFDGTALYEHADYRQGTHPEWGTLVFNYNRNEVSNFLIANALFWLDKYHIDGLRVDAVASMLYLDYGRKDDEWIPNQYGNKENIDAIEFMKHLNSIVYQRFPSALMIAEESTSFFGVSKPTDIGGLGFGFKWNMGWMNDTLQYLSKDPIYRKYHHNSLTFSLLYAFTENFILPMSHDEVVHGKRSLLSKMPGDKWQQFANLRLLFFFLWAHPGKKLIFMGCEFGQISEWYCKVSLDWHLIGQDELHRQLQFYVKELNHFYKEENALWEQDFSDQGFRWMDFNDVDNSIISFARFGKDPKDHVVCLLNFTPNVLHDYKVGVPEKVQYREVFNTDDKEYGGSNVENPDLKVVFDEPFGNAPHHVLVSVPPLGGIILKPVRS